MPHNQNAGAAAAANVKQGPGRVLSARATNINAAARYLCIVDKASAPINGDAVLWWAYLPPQVSATVPSVTEVDARHLGQQGLQVPSNGIAWAVSTTPTTVTLASAADHTVSVRFQ
jgi:hypothetical protein